MRLKLFRARALLLICGFCVRFMWCQNIATSNTTISSCRPGDIKCSNVTDSERNITNSSISSSSLSSDEVKPSSAIENGRGRAMNFTSAFQGNMRSNGLETGLPIPVSVNTNNNRPTNIKEHSIDDVSMDDMDDEYNTNLTSIMSNMHLLNDMMSTFHTPNKTISSTAGACMDQGKVYKLGEKFNKGCDETCQCLKNGVVCSQLCKLPYHTKGRNKNAECTEEAVEGNTCCVTVKCAPKTNLEAKPVEGCTYKNESYKPGTTFKDGCESICTCEDMGRVSCKNRCRPMPSDEDNCVSIVDPKDSCCRIVLCDVEEHANKMETTVSDDPSVSSSTADNQILSAKALNSSSVALTFAEKTKDCNIEASINGVNWENMACVNNIVTGLQPGKKYQFKLKNTASNKLEVILPPLTSHATNSSSCTFKGKTYKIGEEFNDGCEAYCACEASGVECAPIECPTDFGLDVLDPQCLEWETFPANFTPSPPQCCPEKVHCRFNGSCVFNGETFPNWAELPVKVTGCEKRCFCEMSNITCQPMCLPVPETPPKNLHCPPDQAVLMQSTENECCSVWTCPNVGRPDEIKMHVIEAVDDTTIKLVFSVPSFLVGLHGRIELQYTSDQSNDEPSTWEHQILAPPNDLIATKELEFEFGGLKPNTTYKIKIKVMMDDIDNAPTSPILTIRTLSSTALIASTPMPPIIPVEPDLRVVEVNSTYAKIGWRMFSDFELQFIDGVQIRYKEIDDKIYAATPLIHRAVTTYTIEELQPDSIYEVGIYFIPFPGQTTELQAQKTIQIRTTVENDPYKFEIIMEIHHIKTTSVEISWTGIPYPEDKHVNIFRAIYQSEGSREDSSSFKVAKRDSPQSILIQDLKPATRYRLWLEAYLTNGRTKKSNVKDFITKLGPASSSSTSQGKLEGAALVESNSYYGPLVVVAIIATIAVMANVILLLILAKKHGTNKAPITSPINRKNNTSAAYDNPTYKVDIQQETMDL